MSTDYRTELSFIRLSNLKVTYESVKANKKKEFLQKGLLYMLSIIPLRLEAFCALNLDDK